ncbi:MAG: hypothetical protein QGF59_30980, partial [Pirellulaceae bacterium]|nr:hypothetical protein [Pirellulaceae bacterium]
QVVRVVPVDDRDSLTPEQLESLRTVWRGVEPVEDLLPDEKADARILSPRVSPDGETLYCTVRDPGGKADIWRSLLQGRWRHLEPVAELNSDANDIGAAVTTDGQSLFFYSDREGGSGGFDLYVAKSSDAGWSEPVNLGPRLNTAADEYDPAISRDGRTLYFSSDRTRAMAQRAASYDEDADGEVHTLASIEERLARASFDLYTAHRKHGDQPWSPAQPLVSLNSEHDENAPFPSPDETRLFFSSDREVMPNAPRSFDLYVASRNDNGFGGTERLGHEVNTSADETEPALFPDGSKLVFCSNRDGPDAVYVSKPAEVFEQVAWDTSHLATLREVWPASIVTTILVVLFAAVLVNFRRWFSEPASITQFFMASLIFHMLLLVVLAYWSLPTVISIIVTKIHEAEAGSQPFDDNQHQSHEDGQEAWEKLADIQAQETAVDLVRRETEPINLPNQSEHLLPTISVERARLLPTNRVIYTPSAPAEIHEPQQASERDMAAPDAPIEVADVVEKLELQPPPTPADPDFTNRGELARSSVDLMMPPAELSPDLDTMPSRPINVDESITDVAPILSEPKQAEASTREFSDIVQQVAEISDDPETPIIPSAKEDMLPAPVNEEIKLARTAPSQPILDAPPEVALVSPRALGTSPQLAGNDRDDAKPADPNVNLSRSADPPTAVSDISQGDSVELDSPQAEAGQQLAAQRMAVELIRSDAPPPRIEVPTPRETAGPAKPDRNVAVGEVSNTRFDVPPTFGPIVSTLDRPRATATRVVYAEDSVGLREMFTLRQGDIRKEYILLFDGTHESEVAVNHGLEWLATHQNADGSWSLNNFHANCQGKHTNCSGAGKVKSNTAATGLALLPLLAAGNTHQAGQYQKQVAAAITWFRSIQKENGDLLAGGDAQHIYSHSIAAIALCEVYGMTNDPELKPVVEKALDFVVKAQHAGTGGWRYKPNQPGDTSVVGWAMMALKSGEMAGIASPQPTIDNVAKWLASVEANKPTGGLFGYTNPNATPAMTAEGLLCLQFMGSGRNDPRMRAGADYLLNHLPKPDQGKTSYYWYYGTQVMYHMQGQYWVAWNEKLRDHLVATQIKKGSLAGTWNVVDSREQTGGRLYATALKLLMLEVYYRHLPLYEQLED